MNLADEDFLIVIALINDKAEEQDRNAVKSMELIAGIRSNDPESPILADLEGQVEAFEDDRDKLRELSDQFTLGLSGPLILID